MRGVTCCFDDFEPVCEFLLTRLMRGVTGEQQRQSGSNGISTHTPHARRDISKFHKLPLSFISTHTPHARRDQAFAETGALKMQFLLTRLMRGVTTAKEFLLHSVRISTHTPHARRDVLCQDKGALMNISTHTPHARRDKEFLISL